MIDQNSVRRGSDAQDKHALDRDSIKAAARGRWGEVLRGCGISDGCLTDRHGPCPVCGGSNRFRYDDLDGDGTFFCNNCGAGDGFKLLMLAKNINFPAALELVSNYVAAGSAPKKFSLFGRTRKMPPVEPITVDVDHKQIEYNELLWSKSQPIETGTPAFKYFQNRYCGLYAQTASESKALRWYDRLRYVHPDGSCEFMPGIVARVENECGEFVAIHRTFITADGNKACVPAPKKLTKAIRKGAVNGAAIRLFQPEPEGQLIIGEGIETTLAAIHLWGLPGWAAISAGGMERILLPPVNVVRDVVIAVDHDTEKNGVRRGRAAALMLCERLEQEGRNVQMIQPKGEGLDIDDVMVE